MDARAGQSRTGAFTASQGRGTIRNAVADTTRRSTKCCQDQLRVALAELEKLTIRAPIAGTVLKVDVKAGEVAAPSLPQPLLLLGDLSQLRVRAELDEHNTGKIKVGEAVIVRAE